MSTLHLTPETVAAYTDMLTNPAKYKQSYKPISECFTQSEVATAKHELFSAYAEYINKPLPKIMFYIIMDSMYPQGVDPKGVLGYFVKLSVL